MLNQFLVFLYLYHCIFEDSQNGCVFVYISGYQWNGFVVRLCICVFLYLCNLISVCFGVFVIISVLCDFYVFLYFCILVLMVGEGRSPCISVFLYLYISVDGRGGPGSPGPTGPRQYRDTGNIITQYTVQGSAQYIVQCSVVLCSAVQWGRVVQCPPKKLP